jgi:hypothetical protein
MSGVKVYVEAGWDLLGAGREEDDGLYEVVEVRDLLPPPPRLSLRGTMV